MSSIADDPDQDHHAVATTLRCLGWVEYRLAPPQDTHDRPDWGLTVLICDHLTEAEVAIVRGNTLTAYRTRTTGRRDPVAALRAESVVWASTGTPRAVLAELAGLPLAWWGTAPDYPRPAYCALPELATRLPERVWPR